MRAPLCTVTLTPEVIGVLAWWVVILGAPMLVWRRWWRRRAGARRHRGLRTRAEPDTAHQIQQFDRTSGGAPPSTPVRTDLGIRPTAGAPRGPVGTLLQGTLEPLCRYVDFRRRLEVAVAELERRLAALPADRWRVEPYPLTGERRNTLLVLGETGVFVISATYPPGHWDDVVTANTLAGKIQQLLPGYAGEVQPAICHPFTSMEARIWHRADEHDNWVGAWLVGGTSVVEWLAHFGTEAGLGPGDLEHFDQLAKPNWMKAAIPAPPTWPVLPDPATRRTRG